MQTTYDISSIIPRTYHVHGLKLVYRFNIIITQKFSNRQEKQFLQSQYISEYIEFRSFHFPFNPLSPPNHTFTRHLAQLTSLSFLKVCLPLASRSPRFLLLLLPRGPLSLRFLFWLSLFFQTAKCFWVQQGLSLWPFSLLYTRPLDGRPWLTPTKVCISGLKCSPECWTYLLSSPLNILTWMLHFAWPKHNP